MPADPIAALIDILQADAGVTAHVGTRVFAGELPRSENDDMPRPAVVLKPAGGGLIGTGYQQYGDLRVDVDCYGSTILGSWLLWLDVNDALKNLQRVVAASTLVHWARPSSRGITAREPDTDWPVTVSSWQVLASETAVA